MSTLTNPHDKFFKTVFSQKEVAVDFLRHYLPADVIALLEPESLEYVKESFVDPHLREFFSDSCVHRLLENRSARAGLHASGA